MGLRGVASWEALEMWFEVGSIFFRRAWAWARLAEGGESCVRGPEGGVRGMGDKNKAGALISASGPADV